MVYGLHRVISLAKYGFSHLDWCSDRETRLHSGICSSAKEAWCRSSSMLFAVVMVSLATELSAVMWSELEYFGTEDSCTDRPKVRKSTLRETLEDSNNASNRVQTRQCLACIG